jgi:hypothetical protein
MVTPARVRTGGGEDKMSEISGLSPGDYPDPQSIVSRSDSGGFPAA